MTERSTGDVGAPPSGEMVHVPEGFDLHPRLAAALQKVNSLLTVGEKIREWGVELPLPAYIEGRRRALIVATDRRLIVIRRGVGGGFNMIDIQWQDLVDARVRERALSSLFGCELIANTRRGRFSVPGVVPAQAFSLYTRCQALEQEWREKNRVRAMEESRVVHGRGALGEAPKAGVLMDRLKELKELREAGVLTDVEFESMKAKILAGMA